MIHSLLRVNPFLSLIVVVAAWLTGCSDTSIKRVTVKGNVTYQGKQLKSGILQFMGPNGSYSASVIQSDGSFIITDVLPGEVTVCVVITPQGSGDSSGKSEAVAKVDPVSLPGKYRDPGTSPLKYTITLETKTLDIAIKD